MNNYGKVVIDHSKSHVGSVTESCGLNYKYYSPYTTSFNTQTLIFTFQKEEIAASAVMAKMSKEWNLCSFAKPFCYGFQNVVTWPSDS